MIVASWNLADFRTSFSASKHAGPSVWLGSTKLIIPWHTTNPSITIKNVPLPPLLLARTSCPRRNRHQTRCWRRDGERHSSSTTTIHHDVTNTQKAWLRSMRGARSSSNSRSVWRDNRMNQTGNSHCFIIRTVEYRIMASFAISNRSQQQLNQAHLTSRIQHWIINCSNIRDAAAPLMASCWSLVSQNQGSISQAKNPSITCPVVLVILHR